MHVITTLFHKKKVISSCWTRRDIKHYNWKFRRHSWRNAM